MTMSRNTSCCLRRAEELDGIVHPRGESTTMSKHYGSKHHGLAGISPISRHHLTLASVHKTGLGGSSTSSHRGLDVMAPRGMVIELGARDMLEGTEIA